MEGEVEIFVVDPYRSSELCGNPSHPLPIARHKGDPLADQRDEPLVVEVIRPASKTSTVPTWPGVCAVSRASNETSSGVSRCGIRAFLPWESLEPLRYYRAVARLRANGFAAIGNLVCISFVEDWWERVAAVRNGCRTTSMTRCGGKG